MGDRINVTTQFLRETADEIRKKNTAMDGALNEIQKIISNLQGSYVSDSGKRLRENMATLKPRMDEYKRVIESYAAHLIMAADTYEKTETTLTQLADEFKQ